MAQFAPSIELGIARTDNLTLVPEDPEAATVWNLVPAFTYMREAQRLTASAAYRAEAYYYDQRSESEVYHQFDGDLSVGVIPDRFFFNLGASRGQSIVDPQSTIPTDNLAISTNRVDVDDHYAGPSFEIPVGGNAVMTGDFQRMWVNYGESELSIQEDHYNYDTGEFTVDNYRRGEGFTWAVRYNHEEADYGDSFYEYREAGIELGFWASQNTRVFVGGGKQSPWDDPVERGLEDSFWEVGFARELGGRLQAELAAGEQTYGSSGRVILDVAFDRGNSTVSYTETPTTNSFDRFSQAALPDPDDPQDFLLHAGTVERYVSKRSEWTVDLDFQRTDVHATLYDEAREERTQIDGTPLPDELQSGVVLSATWQLGVRTLLTLSGARANREYENDVENVLTVVALEADHELGSRTHLTIGYSNSEDDSETSPELSYRARLLSASVIRSF